MAKRWNEWRHWCQQQISECLPNTPTLEALPFSGTWAICTIIPEFFRTYYRIYKANVPVYTVKLWKMRWYFVRAFQILLRKSSKVRSDSIQSISNLCTKNFPSLLKCSDSETLWTPNRWKWNRCLIFNPPNEIGMTELFAWRITKS